MFITKKKHKKIVAELDRYIEVGQKKHIEIVAELKKELEEAKNLKLILEKLYPLYGFVNGSDCVFVNGSGGYSLNFPDTVLQYTDDILGGKVIKQEGTKCLVISKEGNVKTGLTKHKADKEYSYKLVRE